MQRILRYWLALFALLFASPFPSATAIAVEASLRKAAVENMVRQSDGFWRQIATADPRPTSGCRQLVGTALTLCEARVHPERLERLFALARQMQDQDPKSKNWGNLRWSWRDAGVTDGNAVEFCMQDALLIHIRHGDWLPPAAKKELADLLRLGVEGCLRHRVLTDYTNIAILNAGNLIVLGERLDRADAVREGYRRLDAFCLRTAAFGVHEFCSPTYYCTDLDGLLLIHTYARGMRQRQQADALLQLFWTDIAANWFPAAQRLGGCHSRSYDYVRGLGALDYHFWNQGWLEPQSAGSAERCEPWSDEWSPSLVETRRQLPRWVRQHWGILPAESRSHMLYGDISLSCCGAGYGSQDATLTVDLPGDRKLPRCYFIPDGREDPYGKQKYETGSARHAKALHIQPFWAGTQRAGDALGLVIYRGRDLAAAEVFHVQSHFVFRRTADIWLDGKRLAMPADTTSKRLSGEFWPQIEIEARRASEDCALKRAQNGFLACASGFNERRPRQTASKVSEVPIPAGGSLVLWYGSAAVGVRVPWSYVHGKKPATVSLVDDGNEWNCLRLTVNHGQCADVEKTAAGEMAAGAAFWIRVGSQLTSAADFDAWREEFDNAKRCVVVASAQKVRIAAPCKEGPLSIAAEAPWDQAARVQLLPKPYQGVLEVDGKELGRPMLDAVEPLISLPPGTGPLGSTTVPARKAVFWEAESGLVLPGMAIGGDVQASGGRYVGQESTPIGQPSGSVMWSLMIEKAGRYWLWARVRSADARRGSVLFQVIGEDGPVMPPATWILRSPGPWQWQPLKFEGEKSPTALDLSKGVYRIQLQVRQTGTMIDRLMLTADPKQQP